MKCKFALKGHISPWVSILIVICLSNCKSIESQHKVDKERLARLSLIVVISTRIEADLLDGKSEREAYELERKNALANAKLDESSRYLLDQVSFDLVKEYREKHVEQMATARKNAQQERN